MLPYTAWHNEPASELTAIKGAIARAGGWELKKNQEAIGASYHLYNPNTRLQDRVVTVLEYNGHGNGNLSKWWNCYGRNTSIVQPDLWRILQDAIEGAKSNA